MASEQPDVLRAMDRARNLRRYGISPTAYDGLMASQNGCCAICHLPPEGRGKGGKLHVDHDHETGRVRGLLCGLCNTALGGFQDNTDNLLAAVRYLQAAGT